jgi:hypothetical protein
MPSKPTEEKPSFYELIYDPERTRGLGMQPKRYAKGSNVEVSSPFGIGLVEITGKWIIPGRNKLSFDDWSHISADPEAQDFLRKGVYQLISPISNTGTLADFNEKDALELVDYSYDNSVLELELLQEKRTSVLQKLRQQIQVNEEKVSNSNISLVERG